MRLLDFVRWKPARLYIFAGIVFLLYILIERILFFTFWQYSGDSNFLECNARFLSCFMFHAVNAMIDVFIYFSAAFVLYFIRGSGLSLLILFAIFLIFSPAKLMADIASITYYLYFENYFNSILVFYFFSLAIVLCLYLFIGRICCNISSFKIKALSLICFLVLMHLEIIVGGEIAAIFKT